MLVLKNVTLNPLFADISFEKNNGLIGIVGPSGSGKTTFLKSIGGFVKLDKGEILFDKHNIKQGKILNSNYRLGFHFQDYKLLDLDVKTNIELPFVIGNYKKDESWINYLLDYFEIKKLIDKNVAYLSGGEKERVSIVKAFVNKPNLVLLDEAGSALDKKLKTKLYEFMKQYGNENLLIFISHDENINTIFNLKENLYSGNFDIISDGSF